MKLKYLIGAVAFAALAGGGVMYFVPRENPEQEEREPQRTERRKLRREPIAKRTQLPQDAVREAMTGMTFKKRKRMPYVPKGDIFDHLKGADRRIAERLQKSLDKCDYDAVRKVALEALASENPEIRENAVDALGWFGAEALPELTACMSDKDEDVADSARSHWGLALSELDSADDRFTVGMAVLSTITDEGTLNALSGDIANAATEFIDNLEDEEDANEARLAVVQALYDVIGTAHHLCAEAAAEAYEDITGYEWLGPDEAERYLKDPDNYEPPE